MHNYSISEDKKGEEMESVVERNSLPSKVTNLSSIFTLLFDISLIFVFLDNIQN